MDIIIFVINLLNIIASIAATEINLPASCQSGAIGRQMRQGYTHQFYRGPKPDHIYRGTGSVYRNGTTGSYLMCAGMCLRDDACKSFNFCQDDRHCELNLDVYSKNMSDLIFVSGCQYYDEDYHEPETEGPAAAEPQIACPTSEPLGLEDGTIHDDSITASSEYRSCCAASKARLNNGAGGWSAKTNEGSWIEVALPDSTAVSGVSTQSDGMGFWVRTYKVSYKTSTSSDLYILVTDVNGVEQIFEGNNDSSAIVTNMFRESIVAAVVRIVPVTWKGGVGMRLELLGCRS